MKCHRAILLLPLTCFVAEAQIKKNKLSITEVLEEYIQLADETTKLLAEVVDTSSAAKAAPKLEKLILKTNTIKEALMSFNEFTPAENEKYLQQYEKPMRVSWGKCYDQIFRLQKHQCFRQLNFARNFRVLCELIQL